MGHLYGYVEEIDSESNNYCHHVLEWGQSWEEDSDTLQTKQKNR